MLLKSLLTRAERHAPETCRRRLLLHWRLLERAEAAHPAAARTTLGYPAVGNWLLHTLDVPDGPPFDKSLAGLGAAAAAAALGAGTGFRLTLPTDEGRLALPGIGAFDARAANVRIVAGPGSVCLTAEGRRTAIRLPRPAVLAAPLQGWRRLRPLPGGSGVLDDLDPYWSGRHPSHGRALPRSPVRSAAAARPWLARWRAALALLSSADPPRAAEVASLVDSVVPIAGDGPGVASGTLRAAPWAVLTTLPASSRTMAEVLVHEVQHSKLAVISDAVPLLLPGGDAEHMVAWRADPRPLPAVLQGTYAHLALADLWRRLAGRRGATPGGRKAALARSAAYAEQVSAPLRTLMESGQLTAEGKVFVAGMKCYLESLSGVSSDDSYLHPLS
ncbi:HEXXH motif-containing putative peptide modification protein [Streptomyces sp. HNM0663]|uniref:HEXXH motif-containing putative peptide modification protein n=1 Tax=Streptomyces chengmaiensis TaxID=3040919 RepID=A0ABT6HEP2_9ACTN|nr:HEXXH motif-containing putative peptide modification protein [Streptomyces chengmaiensis]MDH2387232.1 HEXXH motif-containing putative peptide modification protein [Streptomyces chengmaiensis]